MILSVDTASGVPPYEQVRVQIARMIGAGVLRAGDRLPTIAQLAADLGLAAGTVNRAYRELERDRLIVSHRRRGSFVADTSPVPHDADVQAELAAAVDRFTLEVRQLGVEPERAVSLVATRLAGR